MRIGIDVGGTKIEGMLLNESGVELARVRVDTPRHDYVATVNVVAQLVEEFERQFGLGAKVGVGIPGSISSATGLIKNANSIWLNGQPLQDDLNARLQRQVRLANDADCFTISESTDGAGAGAQMVFGVILGTGVGGGLCWKGSPISGPNALVGEWGHNPLPWPEDHERPGPNCYCGHQGCLETFLSGPAFQKEFFLTTGQNLSPKEIYAQTLIGDLPAEKAFLAYEHRLARGLATVINIVDPNVIVLGGGLSNFNRLYTNVPKLWNTWVFSDRVDTELVPAKHGDSSGVRGAAWLWPP